MEKLIEHYNKFNEDKRLLSRHGQVEFKITMKYIHEFLNEIGPKARILDIGAATGAYSIPLAQEGYEVHAIELVKHNVARLKSKVSRINEECNDGETLNLHAVQGNALKTSKKFERNYFDLVLVFGPMYHLFSYEDKLKVLEEAKKVTKKGGIIMVAYLMNDYAVVKHGFIENTICESKKNNKIDSDFNVCSNEDDLYDYVTMDIINRLVDESNLKRIKIFTPDGPANYIRNSLRELDEESYEMFVKYVETIAERADMMGAAGHTVDILQN